MALAATGLCFYCRYFVQSPIFWERNQRPSVEHCDLSLVEDRELLHAFGEVTFRHNGVATVYALGLMASELHCDRPRNSGAGLFLLSAEALAYNKQYGRISSACRHRKFLGEAESVDHTKGVVSKDSLFLLSAALSPAALSVYQLGNFGTVANKLKSWELKL